MKNECVVQMFKMAQTSLFLMAVWSWNGNAEDCQAVRLDGPGQSMEHIPTMDQDSKWICYGYAAAQMVDAWRFSHGDVQYDHITSPVAAATFYSTKRTDTAATDFDFGSLKDTLMSIRKNGSCDYKTIYRQFGQKGLSEYFGSLKAEFEGFKLLLRKNTDPPQLKSYQNQIQCTMKTGGGEAASFNEIAEALNAVTYLEFIDKLFRPVCDKANVSVENLPTPHVLVGSHLPGATRSATLKNKIDERLSSENPQPVGIDICENVLWDKNIDGVGEDGNVVKGKCTSEHSTVIIGQRASSDGKCEVLIKNSHGDSCNGYPDWSCEEGKIWVDADVLARNTTRLYWLGDQ